MSSEYYLKMNFSIFMRKNLKNVLQLIYNYSMINKKILKLIIYNISFIKSNYFLFSIQNSSILILFKKEFILLTLNNFNY